MALFAAPKLKPLKVINSKDIVTDISFAEKITDQKYESIEALENNTIKINVESQWINRYIVDVEKLQFFKKKIESIRTLFESNEKLKSTQCDVVADTGNDKINTKKDVVTIRLKCRCWRLDCTTKYVYKLIGYSVNQLII